MALVADRAAFDLAGRCIRPLGFGLPGDEHYGMPMIEVDAGSGRRDRNLIIGLQGSCTLISYRGWPFVLFTRHQIAEPARRTPEDLQRNMDLAFVMLSDGRDTVSIPLNGLLAPFEEDQEDENDFLIAVVEPSMLDDFAASHFFPVCTADRGQVGDDAVCGGYPLHRQELLMERGGQRTEPVAQTGTISHRTAHSTGIVDYPPDGEPLNGSSGGAVFAIRPEHGLVEPVLLLDGLIQRGGGGRVRYLTIERILSRIDVGFTTCASDPSGSGMRD
ncbi:hypothetical protein [Methylobacterium sp. WSM2598]|uniref:hypothetical protein n=1 Tax=Methylobacterium sp. WSM2598 TaxID=398261 RepID=UPI000378015A|nr:hypothetical protein [Methylobacterium sp. WSM2598]